MLRSSLLATAALGALVFSTSAAQAQCTPNNPGNGQTVTCATDDTNGFSDGSDNVTINVSAQVTNASGDAFNLDGENNVVNNIAHQGYIDGSDEGIQFDGDDSQLYNGEGAWIEGDDRGVDADNADGVLIDNSGYIYGKGSDAVRVGDDATVTNRATGTIQGADDGLQTGDDAVITNDGIIAATAPQASGSSEGITGGDRVKLVNSGTILALDDAFQTGLDADITNTGEIRSLENDGIDIDTGKVVNSGTIIAMGVEDGIDFDAGVDTASISTIENQLGGYIGGVVGVNVDAGNDARQFITNAGTIVGVSGVAVFLEEGEDAFTLLETGVVEGTVDLGADDDLLTLAGVQAALVGGGGLFDGGADIDTIAFDGLASTDLLSLTIASLASTLEFRNEDGSISTLLFANFEFFSLKDGLFAIEDFASAVPIPAAGFLFAGALGAFGVYGRKKRAA